MSSSVSGLDPRALRDTFRRSSDWATSLRAMASWAPMSFGFGLAPRRVIVIPMRPLRRLVPDPDDSDDDLRPLRSVIELQELL